MRTNKAVQLTQDGVNVLIFGTLIFNPVNILKIKINHVGLNIGLLGYDSRMCPGMVGGGSKGPASKATPAPKTTTTPNVGGGGGLTTPSSLTVFARVKTPKPQPLGQHDPKTNPLTDPKPQDSRNPTNTTPGHTQQSAPLWDPKEASQEV